MSPRENSIKVERPKCLVRCSVTNLICESHPAADAARKIHHSGYPHIPEVPFEGKAAGETQIQRRPVIFHSLQP